MGEARVVERVEEERTPQSAAQTAPLSQGEPSELAVAIREIVGPVMAQVADILRRNNEAMERLAAQQQVMTARIADLEKQVRLKTPLSKSQEKCVNDAIRARARELMEGKGYGGDGKAVTKIAAAIRKSVLARYGVGSLREAPAYDYEVCMESAKRWCDLVVIRDVVKEARARAEESEE